MKKRIIVMLLALSLCLCACGKGSAETAPVSDASETTAPAAAEAPTPAPAETPAPAQEPEEAPQAELPEETADTEAHSGVLVVYFSATGNTRGVAEKIAALTGADLKEIVPAQPYTAEDLNYSDRATRASAEQNTPDARPEIAEKISLDGYTTVYLGYPIWWGQAPRILSTFVESHDFTGITVIPFCTSGSSGPGRTGEELGEQAGTGTFLPSTRLRVGISEADLSAWIGEYEAR